MLARGQAESLALLPLMVLMVRSLLITPACNAVCVPAQHSSIIEKSVVPSSLHKARLSGTLQSGSAADVKEEKTNSRELLIILA